MNYTPLWFLASLASVVLDGSASTSASGGRQAAPLQTPEHPKATVDFVNGPGLYMVQLTVPDANGNSAKSSVAMLTCQLPASP